MLSKVPDREKWLYENKEVLRQILQGIKDASEGKFFRKGSFRKYINEDK